MYLILILQKLQKQSPFKANDHHKKKEYLLPI